MKQSVQFVYFDLGGVLVDYVTALEKSAREIGIPEEAVMNLFLTHVKDIDRGVRHWKDFEDIFYRTFQPKQKLNAPLLHFFVDKFEIIPETHDLIRELSGQVKVGILSNIAADAYQYVAGKNLIPDVPYDAEIVSGTIGMLKPEPEIFSYAAEKAGVPAETILFVDDVPENIQAAKSLGWQGVVFDIQNPQQSVGEIREALSV